MIEITLKKPWQIRAGVLIPKGTKMQVAPVFKSQLEQADMLREEKVNSKNQ